MPELPVIVLWIDAPEVVERVLPQITPLIERVTPEARPGLVATLVRSLPLLHGSDETQELARHAHGKTAKDFMQEDYVQASRDEAIGAVLKRMLDRQKKIAVLVDEDGRLAGMVDRRDLLAALA